MNKFEVKEVNGFKSLFSKQKFQKGDVVIEITGQEISKPSRTSVQTLSGKHIDVEAPLKYTNHSCNPNLALTDNNNFIALEDIKSGEELTFNYNLSEDELAAPFKCRDCGKLIKGRKYSLTSVE